MKGIVVNGGKKLNGAVSISGMKNAALPIIFASVLTGDICVLENVPAVSDIENSLAIIEEMGAKITRLSENKVIIDTKFVAPCTSSQELVSSIRGSSYLLGAELGRFGMTKVYHPGGCSIGSRPLDQHNKAFEALGAAMSIDGGYIVGRAPAGLFGNTICFDIITVGGTVNAILASVLAEGVTTIENAAREPHIVDLVSFLNCCGASISGAGTSTIKIRGVESLHGCKHSIIPDMIEAGTYMVAAAVAGGCVTVANIIPKHMESVTAKLREMGVSVEEDIDSITVTSTGKLKPADIITAPYPGFPTDMQPQFTAALCYADGFSVVREEIFNTRFTYTGELEKMGANVKITANSAIIYGKNKLSGAILKAPDLRAGAAMVIAALAAEGKSVITQIEYIERGYDDIAGKLALLGAEIEKKELKQDEISENSENSSKSV